MNTSKIDLPYIYYDENIGANVAYIPLMITNNEEVKFVQTDPDSHYFTDLNQVLESLKYLNYLSYNHLIIAVQNSKKNGYEILDKDGNEGIYILETLEHNLREEKSAVQLTKILNYLINKSYNIRKK